MRTELDMRTIPSGKCELDLRGTRHECRLDSISATGAQVNCLGFLQESHQGDKALLHLHFEPGELACRVTHIAGAKIRLRFAGQ